MGKLHRKLVKLRHLLLLTGWGLLIAHLTLAVERGLKAKMDGPELLSSRIAPFTLTNTKVIEDGTILGARDVPRFDRRGRPGFVDGQLIVRFRDGVTGARCDQVILARHAQKIQLLDSFRSIYLVELPPGETVAFAMEQFSALADVDYAVPNALYYPD